MADIFRLSQPGNWSPRVYGHPSRPGVSLAATLYSKEACNRRAPEFVSRGAWWIPAHIHRSPRTQLPAVQTTFLGCKTICSARSSNGCRWLPVPRKHVPAIPTRCPPPMITTCEAEATSRTTRKRTILRALLINSSALLQWTKITRRRMRPWAWPTPQEFDGRTKARSGLKMRALGATEPSRLLRN